MKRPRARILIACILAFAAFGGSWWVLSEVFDVSQGASLGIAGAIMAVVLFVLGFWIMPALAPAAPAGRASRQRQPSYPRPQCPLADPAPP